MSAESRKIEQMLLRQQADALSSAVYGADQVREMDRIAIEEQGIAGFELMQRAAAAVFAEIEKRWPQADELLCCCGAGNNAGDGYLIAGLAKQAGYAVTVIALSDPGALAGDAALAAGQWLAGDIVHRWDLSLAAQIQSADIVVDALLGTGLAREVTGDYAEVIAQLNQRQGKGVVAVDIPSGLSADTGQVLGSAVIAKLTVTLIGAKFGLYTGRGRDYAGEIRFADLDVPQVAESRLKPMAKLLQPDQQWLPPRRPSQHKGHHGHVLVIGGNAGMAGAARLAGEAALRCGAGLTTVVCHPASAFVVNAERPELMCRGLIEPRDDVGLDRASVIAIGPGLGTYNWARGWLQWALAQGKPLVLDADALNLLDASIPDDVDAVLTPHPGEAGRLLGCTTAAIEQDRLAAVKAIADQYAATVVLKGAGTLVAGAGTNNEPGHVDHVALCAAGNPGMGSGGMGDVLTGVIAALLAQGDDTFQAATRGVWLHALAADIAAESGQRGLLASDLFGPLRELVNYQS